MIKTITTSIFAFTAGLIFINAINKTSGGHPSSTGAPGEKTCAQTNCHTDAVVKNDDPANTFTFSDANNTYKENGIYNASIEVKVPNVSKFGFMVVAIDSATKQNMGSWIITDKSKMYILTGESPNESRNYITHSTAGTVASTAGQIKWNFRWQAPNANKGTIVFYYATNATNSNDASNGDQLFLSSHKIRYSANSVKVSEAKLSKPSLKSAGQNLIISCENQSIQSLEIYNLEGKLVYENKELRHGDLINKSELKLSSNLALVYQIKTDKGRYKGKIIL